ESQSAFRMVTYIDAIHPTVHLYDGYFVHSRGAIGAPLSEAPQAVIPVPGTARIRSDLDVPVLTLETESDLTFLGYFAARQDDSKRFRLWEVAGTSHADVYTLTGVADVGDSSDVVALVVTAAPLPGFIDCAEPINSGPQHFVVNAAFAALDRWVRHGKPPKPAPRLEVAAGPPVAIMRDGNGNAVGGVRTPQVDAPIAAFTGEQDGSILCSLFGTTTPFGDATLAALYPSHKAFVSAYGKAVKRAVRAGWILKPDAKLMKQWAARSSVGS
ncbi:MAG: alpha/beta hydrolase domain-containing protein, partial [Candidatus Binatia bacterium]